MVEEVTGDLLRAETDAIVNAVNTVGVMGKGIALQFKQAYPAMYNEYRRAAKQGELRLGQVQVWPTEAQMGPKYVINFPTKGHWRSKTQLDDVRAGLASLVAVVAELEIESIAVPALGCGNGGLPWQEVRPLIEQAFEAMPGVRVQLYLPSS